MEDYIVVLGSGKSVNDLTLEQREFLNSCTVKIGINKYGAFYKKAKIIPTHLYFLDDYDNKTIRFFMYMLKQLKKDKIQELTLLVSDRYKNCLNKNIIQHKAYYFMNKNSIIIASFLIFLGKIIISKINFTYFKKYKYFIKKIFISKKEIRYDIVPKSWELEFLVVDSWKDPLCKWATSLEEAMYHYRGSLTSVLNYISVKFPNKKIVLVGVDLNTSSYFFEKELNDLPFETNDWTTAITKQENKHFSVIDYEGTKIDDVFLNIIKYLKETNNELLSVNNNSYLVEKGYVEKIDL